MKKSDLKTGMVIELRSGSRGLVLLGTSNGDLVVGDGIKPEDQTWGGLSNWKDDLTSDYRDNSDIVRVYDVPPENIYGARVSHSRPLVWSRQITKDEIVNKLGHDFNEIID